MHLHLDNLTPLQLRLISYVLESPQHVFEHLFLDSPSAPLPQYSDPPKIEEKEGPVEIQEDLVIPEPEPDLKKEEVVAEEKQEPEDPRPKQDRDGYIWDERIHAKSKTQNADGRWRIRRNVGKEVIEQVQLEQRQTLPQFTSPEITGGHTELSYETLMAKLTSGISHRLFDRQQVSELLLSKYNISAAGELLNYPSDWGAIIADLEDLANGNVG